MSICLGSNIIDCDCTISSLSPINMALPKVGNNFPFRSLNGGVNLVVSQTPNGVVLSRRRNTEGAYVGISPFSSNIDVNINPLIANNTSIPGYVNTGLYNQTTGIATVSNTGLYNVDIQVETQIIPPFSPSEFTRVFTLYINNVATLLISKTSFSNNTMTVGATQLLALTAGDQVKVGFLVGAAGQPLQFGGGTNNYFAINEL